MGKDHGFTQQHLSISSKKLKVLFLCFLNTKGADFRNFKIELFFTSRVNLQDCIFLKLFSARDILVLNQAIIQF